MGFALITAFWLAFAPSLEPPWACGQTHTVSQAHGGQSHYGANLWAWDFAMDVGDEVRAASAGVVTHIEMSRQAGGCHSSYAMYPNYVLVDHEDGTGALYVHLQAQSSPLKVGDEVRAGDLIARIGLTGYVCGAHLHFQVQQTCGSWFCQSIPAKFKDYSDPLPGTEMVSNNCPPCEADLGGAQTLVSERDSGCFGRIDDSWWSSSAGEGGHHFFTVTTDAPAAEARGTWSFSASVPGTYRVEVFVPEKDAESTNAVYEIQHAEGVALVPVDQAAQKGWRDLGVFRFAGEGGSLTLADNTGPTDKGRRLAFDDVRLTFVPDNVSDDDTGVSTGGTDGGELGTTTDDDGATLPGGTGEAPGDGEEGAGAINPGHHNRSRFTYGCAASGSARSTGSFAMLLLLGLLRRCRRNRRRSPGTRTA